MPRPVKRRKICCEPIVCEFIPIQTEQKDPVYLTMDEYETIRLIDKEGMSQEECSVQMQVARTTAQQIYNQARGKLAKALVEGRTLRIEGGVYEYCNGIHPFCTVCNCQQREKAMGFMVKKGEYTLRVAVTYENGVIFQHFGHTKQFKLYDVQENAVTNTQIIESGESGHSALAGFLKDLKVDTLICGGIGQGAQEALSELGIQVYGGVDGKADEAVEQLLQGNLHYQANIQCNHHQEDGAHHSCGNHRCGEH